MKLKLLAAFVFITVNTFAQTDTSKAKAEGKDKEKKWDVANPPGTFKDVEFTTTEGTWMNLDVSPRWKKYCV